MINYNQSTRKTKNDRQVLPLLINLMAASLVIVMLNVCTCLALFPTTAQAQVTRSDRSRAYFVHRSAHANIINDCTFIDHPLANNNPKAILIVTQNWNPGGTGGKYNRREIGVWYHTVLKQWVIFNLDRTDMAEGLSFNVIAVAAPNEDAFVHQATAANIDPANPHETFISHPKLNDRLETIVLSTPVYNLSGITMGVINNRLTAFWFEKVDRRIEGGSTKNRWAIFNYDHARMPVGVFFNVLVVDPEDAVGFRHVVTADTISCSHCTVIDNPVANANPNALVFVTSHGNPRGGDGVWNAHPVGVWYDGSKWEIFNEDHAPFRRDGFNYMGFNVVVLPSGFATDFIHKATAPSIIGHRTVIDHPLANGNPRALLTVTPNWNPPGGTAVYNNHPIGVWFNGSKWEVFNQDGVAMPENAAFNISVTPAPTESDFVYKASASRIIGHQAVIDHPPINGNPRALLTVTPNWNPPGGTAVYNNHPIGVWFNGSKWEVFNQDGVAMPENAAFNISVTLAATESDFVHHAGVSNIIGHQTVIDHPLTNDNPRALLFVTPNWNPPGGAGVYNNHPIGVWFNGSKWEIFNQDFAAMPLNAAFNVNVYRK